jgi:biotin--protein ligase
VRDVCAPQGGSLDVRIKWPNDLYSGPLKLGGVLCHSSYRGKQFYVIMGVGLNLANRQPTTCVDALVESEAQRLGLPPPPPVTREVHHRS